MRGSTHLDAVASEQNTSESHLNPRSIPRPLPRTPAASPDRARMMALGHACFSGSLLRAIISVRHVSPPPPTRPHTHTPAHPLTPTHTPTHPPTHPHSHTHTHTPTRRHSFLLGVELYGYRGRTRSSGPALSRSLWRLAILASVLLFARNYFKEQTHLEDELKIQDRIVDFVQGGTLLAPSPPCLGHGCHIRDHGNASHVP